MREAAHGVGLISTFQPIVSLPDQLTIGYEALARWPRLDVVPESVFEYAARHAQLDDLDTDCIRSAAVNAVIAELPPGTALFINTEPTSAAIDGMDFTAAHHGALRVVFELTERNLLGHPAALLAKAALLRERGFCIAIDDVGTDDRCLAALDLLEPEVIKLHLHRTQAAPLRRRARLMSAVLAHHDRTGAHILAEGIECQRDLDIAHAIGAHLGQGFLFGRPGCLVADDVDARWRPPAVPHRPYHALTPSPFHIVAGRSRSRLLQKPALLQLTRYIEHQAAQCGDASMMLAAVQRVEFFDGPTRRLYTRLTDTAPWVVVFGDGVPSALARGVRGVALSPDDPMRREWIVLTLGTYSACALVGREREESVNSGRPEREREFDTVLTYDRPTVLAAATAMLQRMT